MNAQEQKLIPGSDVASKNLKAFQELRSYYEPVYLDKYKKLLYYYNKQFSNQQIVDFMEQTDTDPYVINIIRTTVEQETAILTSDRPIFKSIPINKADRFTAAVIDSIIYAIAQNNNYDDMHADDIKEALITGISWNRMYPSEHSSEGFFNIKIERVSFFNVFGDPRLKSKWAAKDQDKLLYYDYVPLDTACKLAGMSKTEYVQAVASDESLSFAINDLFLDSNVMKYDLFKTEDSENPMVLYIENYERVLEDFYKIESIDKAAQIEFKLPLYLKQNEFVQMIELDDNFAKAVSSKLVTYNKVKRKNVYCQTSYGAYAGRRKNLRIEYIPIVPLINEWGGSFNLTYGEVHYLQAIQDAINKFMKLTVANAMFSSVGRMIYDKETVSPNQVEDFMSGKTTALGYQKKLPNDTSVPVQFFHGRPLETGFFTLYQDLFQKAEYVSGLYSIMMGDGSKAPDVFSTVAALENFGSQRIKNKARYITNQRAFQAKILLQLIQRYASVTDIIRFVTEDGTNVELKTAMPEYAEAGQIIDILYNVSIGDFDVANVSQPNLGTTRASKANLLNTLLTQQKIPPTATTSKMMADLLDLPELEQVGQELDENKQLKNAAQQMQEQLLELTKINKQLETNLLKSKQDIKLKDFEVQLDKFINKVAADLKVSESELKLAVKDVIKELESTSNTYAEQQSSAIEEQKSKVNN